MVQQAAKKEKRSYRNQDDFSNTNLAGGSASQFEDYEGLYNRNNEAKQDIAFVKQEDARGDYEAGLQTKTEFSKKKGKKSKAD
jgi:hypothetical protein